MIIKIIKRNKMPGTFSQIYIQVVFAVKGRENLISKEWKEDLHKYIAGIIKGFAPLSLQNCTISLIING